MGNLLAVYIHAANIHDTKSGIETAKQAVKKYPSIKGFCADAGYRGTFVDKVREELKRKVDISERIEPHEWEILPWRWVVERTFGWFNNFRRLSKDYEISEDSAGTNVIISQLCTLLKRL